MNEKHAAFRILAVITTPKLADKATGVLASTGIPVEYRMAAEGTATSEIMDVLGLGSIDKTVLFSMLPKSLSRDVLKKLRTELKLGSVNSGIAFTVPLTGMNNFIIHMLQDIENNQPVQEQKKGGFLMSDTKYSAIVAIINRGYSNDLMEAARQAGASGGSVLKSRRIASQEACAKWGLGVQDEKEMVLIVADVESKLEIMKKISESCGLHSEAKGIVMSLPIEDAIGLGE